MPDLAATEIGIRVKPEIRPPPHAKEALKRLGEAERGLIDLIKGRLDKLPEPRSIFTKILELGQEKLSQVKKAEKATDLLALKDEARIAREAGMPLVRIPTYLRKNMDVAKILGWGAAEYTEKRLKVLGKIQELGYGEALDPIAQCKLNPIANRILLEEKPIDYIDILQSLDKRSSERMLFILEENAKRHALDYPSRLPQTMIMEAQKIEGGPAVAFESVFPMALDRQKLMDVLTGRIFTNQGLRDKCIQALKMHGGLLHRSAEEIIAGLSKGVHVDTLDVLNIRFIDGNRGMAMESGNPVFGHIGGNEIEICTSVEEKVSNVEVAKKRLSTSRTSQTGIHELIHRIVTDRLSGVFPGASSGFTVSTEQYGRDPEEEMIHAIDHVINEEIGPLITFSRPTELPDDYLQRRETDEVAIHQVIDGAPFDVIQETIGRYGKAEISKLDVAEIITDLTENCPIDQCLNGMSWKIRNLMLTANQNYNIHTIRFDQYCELTEVLAKKLGIPPLKLESLCGIENGWYTYKKNPPVFEKRLKILPELGKEIAPDQNLLDNLETNAIRVYARRRADYSSAQNTQELLHFMRYDTDKACYVRGSAGIMATFEAAQDTGRDFMTGEEISALRDLQETRVLEHKLLLIDELLCPTEETEAYDITPIGDKMMFRLGKYSEWTSPTIPDEVKIQSISQLFELQTGIEAMLSKYLETISKTDWSYIRSLGIDPKDSQKMAKTVREGFTALSSKDVLYIGSEEIKPFQNMIESYTTCTPPVCGS